jgi:hypothetical protein
MRFILPLLAPLMIASTVPEAPPVQRQSPAAQPLQKERNCRGKIETVREERGLPMLRRENTTQRDAQMILAVDKRIDGCQVLVMASDPRDVRPLPEFSNGPARLQH